MPVGSSICPSVHPPQACKSEVIYRWIFFLFPLFSLSLSFFFTSLFSPRLRLFHDVVRRASFSFRVHRHWVYLSCCARSAGQEWRRAIFFFFLFGTRFFAPSKVHPAGARASQWDLFSFRTVCTPGMCRRHKSVNVSRGLDFTVPPGLLAVSGMEQGAQQ